MQFGYARTSTVEQKAGYEAQLRDLEAAGAEKVFKEQVSSVGDRSELERLLGILRTGDVLIVTKLDRLARSVADLVTISARIEEAGATLKILSLQLDTGNAQGRLMVNVVGAIAQFERELMLERQREGISKAKADGKYKGRKPLDPAITAKVRQMHADKRRPTDIARALGIGRTSVYRALES
ncbi:recombinase family protein [Hyphomicrobium sp.]|uniref:recombinase family protein n=1 Tax=Hyphomicrobium sp. TaxID=82 RepID=UPI000FA721EA|nr:recombinase family protein [Hyphomicrobium sp.]RUO97989.1 MAG: recombinase family protein [Hyphomicrobium sp.]